MSTDNGPTAQGPTAHDPSAHDPSAPDATAGRVRASDGEREAYAEVVREATGDGRLSLDEGDERLAAVYATRFRDELPPLVADLPGHDLPGAARAGEPGRAGGRPPGQHGSRPGFGGPHGGPFGRPGDWPRGWPREGGWPGHRWGGAGRASLGRHVIVAATVSLVLIGIWALSPTHFFWPAIPLIFFALGVVRHARWAGRGRPRS
jgi:hypothetical protein